MRRSCGMRFARQKCTAGAQPVPAAGESGAGAGRERGGNRAAAGRQWWRQWGGSGRLPALWANVPAAACSAPVAPHRSIRVKLDRIRHSTSSGRAAMEAAMPLYLSASLPAAVWIHKRLRRDQRVSLPHAGHTRQRSPCWRRQGSSRAGASRAGNRPAGSMRVQHECAA